MESAIFLVLVAISGALGALTSGVLGWLDSNESFNGRKFASTAVTALISGIALATAFIIEPDMTLFQQVLSLFLVFGSGLGLDAGRNRISKAIAARQATTTTTTPT